MGKAITYLIKIIVMLIGLLNPEDLRKFADMVLDFFEDKITGSEAEWDDEIFMPLIQKVRTAFNVPDND